MKKDTVTIVSLTDGVKRIQAPELRFNRRWPAKGSTVKVDRELLEELMFVPGVKAFFDKGYLQILDLEEEEREELGLEDIVILNDKEREHLLTEANGLELGKVLDTLGEAQIEALIRYAVQNDYVDAVRARVILRKTGKDLLAIYRNVKAAEEDSVE